jgi:hypothetical protein
MLDDGQTIGSVAEAQARRASPSDGAEQLHTTRRTLDALAILGFAFPIAAYFWLIHQYGVNTIWLDQWYNIALIEHPLSLSALWAQHDVHRIFFPNLMVLILGQTTHLNVVFEEYLSGLLLCIALGLLIVADKRSFPSTPWIYYCPIAFVLLSLVQAESTLFGFQLSWYLTILALAVALFLLDRPDLNKLVLTVAIVAAVIGSFSAFEGLFIWPVGLLVLYRRRSSRDLVFAWVVVAVFTVVLYFYNFSWTGNSYWYTHPTLTIKFFFLAIGDVVGAQLANPHTGNEAVLALGVLIFAVACWVIVVYGLRRGAQTGGSIGVALVCFGLLFAVTFAVGRVNSGLSLAGSSQYTTFDLLILAGCYLALLNPPPVRDEERRSARFLWPILRLVLLSAVLLQIVFGAINGVTEARELHSDQISISDITANIDKAPDVLIEREVFQTPKWIRSMAHVAQARHLSLFATSAAATFNREGLFPAFSELSTYVLLPANGATLSGTAVLDAVVTGDEPPTKVTFHLTGGSYPDNVIGTGRATLTPTLAGWVYRWDTSSVANGTYMLRSEAYAGNGKHSYSRAITVTVRN